MLKNLFAAKKTQFVRFVADEKKKKKLSVEHFFYRLFIYQGYIQILHSDGLEKGRFVALNGCKWALTAA